LSPSREERKDIEYREVRTMGEVIKEITHRGWGHHPLLEVKLLSVIHVKKNLD
jgi:hypothetical protein